MNAEEFQKRYGSGRQIFRNERSPLPRLSPPRLYIDASTKINVADFTIPREDWTPTMNTVEFWIAGIPAPGGSKTAFALKRGDGSLVMRPDGKTPVINITDAGGKRNKVWRSVCAHEGLVAMTGKQKFSGPLRVSFEFYMPRPASHFRSGKLSHILREDAPPHHIIPPDTTKLIRSTEDALTGIVWSDDAIIVRQEGGKYYAIGGKTGCRITIIPIDSPVPQPTTQQATLNIS